MDSGKSLPFPDGLLVNGQSQSTFSVNQGYPQHMKHLSIFPMVTYVLTAIHFYFSGNTYMFRISNVGLSTSINFRIQGHKMKLVEVEGSHVVQNIYDTLDVHVGQSVSVLVTLDQPPKDYWIIASTRFTGKVLTSTSVLHYINSVSPVSGPIPDAPAGQVDWSMAQARSFR